MFDLRMLLRMILMVGAPLNLHERCPNCHKVKPSSGIEFSKTLVHLVGTQDEVHTCTNQPDQSLAIETSMWLH